MNRIKKDLLLIGLLFISFIGIGLNTSYATGYTKYDIISNIERGKTLLSPALQYQLANIDPDNVNIRRSNMAIKSQFTEISKRIEDYTNSIINNYNKLPDSEKSKLKLNYPTIYNSIKKLSSINKDYRNKIGYDSKCGYVSLKNKDLGISEVLNNNSLLMYVFMSIDDKYNKEILFKTVIKDKQTKEIKSLLSCIDKEFNNRMKNAISISKNIGSDLTTTKKGISEMESIINEIKTADGYNDLKKNKPYVLSANVIKNLILDITVGVSEFNGK